MPFHVQSAPLETLDQVLPRLIQNLSLSRAQIVIDQLRGAVESKTLDRLVFLTASESTSSETPSAAAIAMRHTDAFDAPGSDDIGSRDNSSCDMATILHAGSLRPGGVNIATGMIDLLSAAIDYEMEKRGARFFQWATDASDTADDSVPRWCQRFGFESIGTLDYMSGPVTRSREPTPAEDSAVPDNARRLRFEPIDLRRWNEFQRFADLVERTYAKTLDCPSLADYRTATQTLRGYQASGAFDPTLWFDVYDGGRTPIGCMVLANHRTANSSGDEHAAGVIEIVYMGLVPEARGRGQGKLLVERAFEAATSLGADRIILGVDQRNTPARAIYSLAGLQPMLTETIWVKSLRSADSATSSHGIH